MTIDELKAAIAEKEAASNDLRVRIQANTAAARTLNDNNRDLMKQRSDIEHEKGQLLHQLHKSEKGE